MVIIDGLMREINREFNFLEGQGQIQYLTDALPKLGISAEREPLSGDVFVVSHDSVQSINLATKVEGALLQGRVTFYDPYCHYSCERQQETMSVISISREQMARNIPQVVVLRMQNPDIFSTDTGLLEYVRYASEIIIISNMLEERNWRGTFPDYKPKLSLGLADLLLGNEMVKTAIHVQKIPELAYFLVLER